MEKELGTSAIVETLGWNLYIHIDNGGVTFKTTPFYHPDGEFAGAELAIENSFYGYTTNVFKLHVGKNNSSLSGKDFRAIANYFNAMASQLPE